MHSLLLNRDCKAIDTWPIQNSDERGHMTQIPTPAAQTIWFLPTPEGVPSRRARVHLGLNRAARYYQDLAVPGIGGHADQPVQVAFKNPNKIVPRGEPLTVRVIVTGGESVESVRLHYRALGEGSYAATPMTRGFRNLYQAVIPASAVTEDGLEYYIEARSVGNELFRVPRYLPSIAVTVVRKETG